MIGSPSCRRIGDLRWLVLAPHPDDETLGAGALIAEASRAGCLAGLVYLTDGSGSHRSPGDRNGRLVSTRRREAAGAVFRLSGSRKVAPLHLGWKDAAPAPPESSAFGLAARRLAALCRRRQVDALAVTALHEPHCDHAAAARLAYAVQALAKRRLLVAEYLVWGGAFERGTHRTVRTIPMPAGKRRHALRAHRSQLTGVLGPGFRLPAERVRMPAADTLYMRRSP
ncbi:PIG-L deacetylase family protein [Novosphingobium sp. AP12]|uniref:PIG-L deacetylase family protein n=1 Tax=Novosphingobium sp. AP12 TaxID=1144305 RepID=UPI001EE661B1|nr:PIG-L family deacetylase [Novosphingobium sp. AP12]